MMQKRGLLRIVEASIAIIIVLGVILAVSVNKRSNSELDLSDILFPILDEIAKNSTLRDNIFIDETGAKMDIELLLSRKIKNPSIKYKIVICGEIYSFCGGLNEYPSDAEGGIFSSERIISTNLGAEIYNPKKLKIYLWRVKN